MSSGGSLYDKAGTNLYNFICQFDCDDVVIKDTTCENGETPPDGYIKIHNRFYQYFPDYEAHNEAREICISEGAKLPSFKTEEEFLGLRQLHGWMATSGWIGLYNPKPTITYCYDLNDCSGKLEWEDGITFTDPNPAWDIPGVFEVDQGRHCVLISSSGSIKNYKPCNRIFSRLNHKILK